MNYIDEPGLCPVCCVLIRFLGESQVENCKTYAYATSVIQESQKSLRSSLSSNDLNDKPEAPETEVKKRPR